MHKDQSSTRNLIWLTNNNAGIKWLLARNVGVYGKGF